MSSTSPELYLREDFQKAWAGSDPFEKVEQLDGEVFRQLEARKTLRFEQDDKSFFVKIHRGVGWYEIIENLIRLRKPVLGAENEYLAIKKLEQLGVDTMTAVAYGNKGSNPAKQQSFIVTEDLINTISLEDFCHRWQRHPPSFRLKKNLITKLAEVSRLLHQNGVNHRDYYICHFLLAIPDGVENVDPDNFKVSLIDLHRTQIRAKTPERWVRKDIAGLYFSALEANFGLSRNDIYRFIRVYTGLPLRQAFKDYHWLWKGLEEKAQKLLDRMQRKLGAQ
ncbi:lipopolysaccharide core heptose(I) kinase RfaP [Parendozoicomonas haliclonae]|uniref:Lipopolysaccharide core heptose(I) kinase n=1 Tax=Parendozoicomonas haliclonae TaxID=1960125 RepID=A0A1X7AJD6_9GAMM|nr:lipopolysaccharide core heptose(I) kinase RfaP [Parendozoicomonas haliclonae]SMA45737.1 Lipopolysaccharide core heptose(I) kinase RfaP [Parendozoicomonas haliclonae]